MLKRRFATSSPAVKSRRLLPSREPSALVLLLLHPSSFSFLYMCVFDEIFSLLLRPALPPLRFAYKYLILYFFIIKLYYFRLGFPVALSTLGIYMYIYIYV